jgi:hypothetical protein
MKKIISLILSQLILLSTLAPLYASSENESTCQNGECVEEIILKLEETNKLYATQCLPLKKEKGISEECWRLLSEIKHFEDKLKQIQTDLEFKLSCEGQACQELAPTNLDNQLPDLNQVEEKLSCNETVKEKISHSCQSDIKCVLFSSMLGVGGYAVEKLLKDDSKMKGCHLGDDSCVTQLITSFVKSVFSFFESSWDLLKSGGKFVGKKIGQFWNWVSGAEDHSSTSQLSLANVSEDEGLFDQLMSDFSGTMMKIFQGLLGGIKEWLKGSVFCQKWSGLPQLSECLQPTNDFDCLPCKQMLTGMCSISGTLVAEVLPAFLTGGLVVAAKYGASAAGKIAKSIKVSEKTFDAIKKSKLGQVSSKAISKTDEALKISRGAKYTKEILQASLDAIKKYFLSPIGNASRKSFETIAQLTKKGALFIGESKAGKILYFSKEAAQKAGAILLYPVDNPLTVWGYKAGEQTFEKIITLGAPKLTGATKGANLLIKSEPALEETLTRLESLKISSPNNSEGFLKLEEELFSKVAPKKEKLTDALLKSKNPNLNEIIEYLYPELKYGDFAKKLGPELIRKSESDLLSRIQSLPDGKIKNELLLQFEKHTSQGVARGEILKHSDEVKSVILDSLKDAPFAQDTYSKEILHALTRAGADEKALEITGKAADEVLKDWSQFQFTNKSGIKVNANPELYVGKVHGSSEKTLNVVGTFVPEGETTPIGFFVMSYPKRSSGNIQPYFEIIKLDTANAAGKGIAAELIPFMGQQIKKSGLDRLDLDADWMGRVVWAKRGFKFDPDVYHLRNGEKISQVDLARENLGRFLDANDMKLEELQTLSASGELIPVTSMNQLKEPLDFINLVHKDGKKVKVRKYVDQGKYDPEVEESVGTAFSLGPSLRREGQKLEIIGTDDVQISDQALFNWMGVLKFE